MRACHFAAVHPISDDDLHFIREIISEKFFRFRSNKRQHLELQKLHFINIIISLTAIIFFIFFFLPKIFHEDKEGFNQGRVVIL